jgi:hypothetical protein
MRYAARWVPDGRDKVARVAGSGNSAAVRVDGLSCFEKSLLSDEMS